jgi:hypothetical protein
MFGVGSATVRQWIKDKELIIVRKGNMTFILASSVHRLMRSLGPDCPFCGQPWSVAPGDCPVCWQPPHGDEAEAGDTSPRPGPRHSAGSRAAEVPSPKLRRTSGP